VVQGAAAEAAGVTVGAIVAAPAEPRKLMLKLVTKEGELLQHQQLEALAVVPAGGVRSALPSPAAEI
jgi:hypothetical protein